ncbi:hypothetical protein FSP39_000683 [Pinctada imbricata]|uniref:Uncharacterized protein n=1 Tax=Pinctada imbricata TaxID=66713 RepID=A0AA88Y2P0_PINIB|nr:hypothetical protein FSP39_000683 [Pinctada imbricata]
MPKLKRRLTSIQKIDEEDLISKETCTSNKEDESGDGNTPKQSSKRKKNGVDDSTLHKATKYLKMDDTQLSGSNKRSRPDKADMIVSSSDGTQGHLPFPTVVKDDQPFSPRRSGRGFKPNRKFKDMELEYNPLKQKVKDKEKQMQSSDMKKPVRLTQNQRKDQMTATVKGSNQGGKGNRSVGKLAKKLQATAVSCISDDDKQCSEETDQGKTRSTKTGQIIRENLSSKSSLPSEDIHVSGIDKETVDISKIDAREAIEDMGDRDLNEVSVILNPETGLFVMSSSGEKVEPSVADSTIVKTEKEVDTEQNVETPKTIHPTNLIELVGSSRTRRTDSKEATVKYREMDKTSKKDGMITKEETVVKRKSLESQSSVNNTYMEISSAENSQLTEVNKDSENDLNGDTTLKEKVDTKCLEDEEALDKGDCSLTKVDAEALEKAVESIAVKTENEIRSDTSIGSVAQGEECGSIQGECDDVSQSEEEVKVAMQSLIENVDDGSVIELVEIPDNESSTVEANLPKLTTPRGTKYVVRGESQDSVLVINTGSNVMMGRNASKRSEDSKGQDTGKQGRVLPAGSFKTQEMQTQTPYNMPISQRIKIIRGEGHSITVTSSSSSDGAPVSETSSGDLAVLNETSAVSGDVTSKSSGKELNEQFIIVELPEGQSVKRKIVKEPEQEVDTYNMI